MLGKATAVFVLFGVSVTGLTINLSTNHNSYFDRDTLLTQIEYPLQRAGLAHFSSASFNVSGTDVARAYHSRDCSGLLIVAPLPQTAQTISHVIPLDFDGVEQFVYQGELFEAFPYSRRMIAALKHVFPAAAPGKVSAPEVIFSVFEVGGCRLIQRVQWSIINDRLKENENT